MKRIVAALVLLVRFFVALVVSGVQTIRVVLSYGSRPPPAALIRMRYGPMSDWGVTLLGCMITLTPGTTTIHADTERRELLLHVLDAGDPVAVVQGIRTDFEQYLLVLFGRE